VGVGQKVTAGVAAGGVGTLERCGAWTTRVLVGVGRGCAAVGLGGSVAISVDVLGTTPALAAGGMG
jgi:hypothetical protein